MIRPLPVITPRPAHGGCGCGSGGCGGSSGWDSAEAGLHRVQRLAAETPPSGIDPGEDPHLSGFRQLLERQVDRRTAVGGIAAGLLAGLGLVQTACNPIGSAEAREKAVLD